MDEFGNFLFGGMENVIRKKRSLTARRPRPELPTFHEISDLSPSSSTPLSDDMINVSGEANGSYAANSRKNIVNLKHCGSRDSLPFKAHINGNGTSREQHFDVELDNDTELGQSVTQCTQFNEGSSVALKQSGLTMDYVENEMKLKKVKLKLGGVTRTIQAKTSSERGSGNGSHTLPDQGSHVPRHRQKLFLQKYSDDRNLLPFTETSGFQGIAWKEYPTCSSGLGKEKPLMRKLSVKCTSEKQGEKSDAIRKSKRVPKRRVLDGEFDEDDEDDEIRYLEKLKSSKASSGFKCFEDETSKRQKHLSKIGKGGKYSNLEDSGPPRSARDGNKKKTDRVSEDIDYEEDEQGSDCDSEGNIRKKQRKDPSDPLLESKKEVALTTRQRALLSSKDAPFSTSQIEFPDGLPPPLPRKPKEKLSEMEQQLKKAEAAQRRRMQNEKAARESEAEAIRKILGQDSSRKKREDQKKKRQEELAQEKAANARMLASNTIRWIMGPTGNVVTFPEDVGLPFIFDPKPCSYPPPREKCAGPSCGNTFKYRDSKSNLPLCSLQCYKAIQGKMTEAA